VGYALPQGNNCRMTDSSVYHDVRLHDVTMAGAGALKGEQESVTEMVEDYNRGVRSSSKG